MKRQEFIDAVYDAGWRSVGGDAQHKNIGALWERLFPAAAAMEQELENYRAVGRDDCIRIVEQMCTAIDGEGTEYNRSANAEQVLQALKNEFYT